MRRSRSVIATLALALLPSLLACGAEGDSAEVQTAQAPVEASAPTPAPGASAATAPTLEPAATFALEEADQLTDIAMSPDGSRIVAATQPGLGSTLTLRLYDASTGEVLASTGVEGIGLGRIYWLADGRLISPDREMDGSWRSWDGATLDALPSVPRDETCHEGRVDKNTGMVFSTEGRVTVGDHLCRVDTSDGSILRTDASALQEPDLFWVRPSSGEVLVLHSPTSDDSKELIVLDGATLTPTGSSMVVEFRETVEAVGRTTWIRGNRTARLEPGAVPAPDITGLQASGAGSYFISSNGMDDFVFYSATDASEIGSIPAGMNLFNFADWSIDDSWFVRLTIDRMAEVYSF